MFDYGGKGPVDGERMALFQMEKAAGFEGLDVLDGVIADIAEGGGGVCHFEG